MDASKASFQSAGVEFQGNMHARYDWQVDTTQAWMKLMAPVARPFFAWNHDVIMRWGAQGLAKRLGVKVVEQQT